MPKPTLFEILNSKFSSIKLIYKIIFTLIIASVAVIFLYNTSWRAPKDFPTGQYYTIDRGDSLAETADKLYERNIISSSLWFKTFFYFFYGSKELHSGDYVFDKTDSLFTLVTRLAKGDFHLINQKTVIPEGLNTREIGNILEKKFFKFNAGEFAKKAEPFEGFLFPDTYLFLPNTDVSKVIEVMVENYKDKLVPLKDDILATGLSLTDIIKLASIVELEGKKNEDRKVIAGILLNRLKSKMPLQVDVSFKYYNGKNSYTLTSDDLHNDHPYNTYTRIGLPPTPICNPGIESVQAVLHPTISSYIYFLSAKDGTTYYAKTYSEHLKNKLKYMK